MLFVTRRYPPSLGGMQTFARDFYGNYRRLADVDMIANAGGNWMLLAFMIRTLLALAFRRGRYDVVHLYDAVLAPMIPAIKALTGAQVSVTVNGLDIVYPRFGYQRIVSSFLNRADKVFAISQQTAAACLARGVGAGKVVVIHNGIDTLASEICTKEAEAAVKSKIRAALQGKRVLLTVGRLVRRKGHAWFVSNVLKDLPEEYVYVIAGEGPERAALERAAREAGVSHRVQMLGHVSEVEKQCLFRMAHVFVMPNIAVPGDQEGFGIVLLEAGLQGLPVVGSDMEGLRDAVIDGQTGVLVRPGDVQGFQKAIIDPGLDAESIRSAVISTYDWRITAKRYDEEFRKMLTAGGRAAASLARR